jgi:hypothetical protein
MGRWRLLVRADFSGLTARTVTSGSDELDCLIRTVPTNSSHLLKEASAELGGILIEFGGEEHP